MLTTAKRTLLEAKIGDVIALVQRPMTTPMRDPAWHVLQCIGHSDRHVIDWMLRSDFETYYPVVNEMRPVPKRQLSAAQRKSALPIMKPIAVPVFPRYVFVRFDMVHDQWRDIFKFAGAGGLICGGGLPVRVPDELIGALRASEVCGVIPGKTQARMIFGIGEKVRISDGPFIGFPALIEGACKDDGVIDKDLNTIVLEDIDAATRINVLINLLGRMVPVRLEITQIEKL